MQSDQIKNLPIVEVLDALRLQLAERDELVLQAPPGAGKTTVVPLALLGEPWLAGRRILVLEPRRMAARTAAERMAALLGEKVGQTVGYRIRLENCVSERTRIEVITEGILARRLQADPALADVGLVIFDEFHERSLDSDLCLALCLQGRALFRDEQPLKLLVMSATLDGEAVAALLDNAPVLTSSGRQYPVQAHYLNSEPARDMLAPAVASATLHALREQPGNVLVFLPGQREIAAVGRELARSLPGAGLGGVAVSPLFGGLSLARQQQAMAPPAEGMRKVVLATNVAETSLTIEGIAAVVDAGLVREADFDPNNGITRLATRRIAADSAEQRQGRAGRLGPGHCYRLWSREQHQRLQQRSSPEILRADLAPLALQLLAFGVADPEELAWLDAPPRPAWQQALALLRRLGAVADDEVLRLTPYGETLAALPLHPRLGHMLVTGAELDAAEPASLLAALLSERNPLADSGVDIGPALAMLAGSEAAPDALRGWVARLQELARRYRRLLPRRSVVTATADAADITALLLASAYPDRIARRRRDSGGDYLLANGRAASLPDTDRLAREEWLAVAELGGERGASSDRIFAAVPLSPHVFDGPLAPLVSGRDQVEWDDRDGRLLARRLRNVGAIELGSMALKDVPEGERSDVLLAVLRRRGLELLPWTDSLRQWRARVALLRKAGGDTADNPWPDLSDEALLASADTWLAPWLAPVRSLADFKALDLRAILHSLLPWPLPLELERLAPERFGVPSGSSITIDYLQQPPVLAVKLQEMFGCEETPTVANGQVALQVHLLSPAQRPLQVTQDLAGFWRSSYQEVRREMRGRYPKHPWPENPLEATATRHTKRRAAEADKA